MHIRTQVRDAIEAALSGLVNATAYMERKHRMDAGLLPAVLVYLTDCEPQDDMRATTGPFTTETVQTLVCELHAEGVDGKSVAEAIDAMESEVETALAGDAALMALIEILEPAGSQIEMNSEQDRVLGVRSVSYNVTWRHVFGAPETPES